MNRISLTLATAVALCGCAPPVPATAPAAAMAAEARLALTLPAGPVMRRVTAMPSVAAYRVTLASPGGASLSRDVAAASRMDVDLSGWPTGQPTLIRLEGLTAQGEVLPAAGWGAMATFARGLNVVALSDESTMASEVAAAVLQADQANGTRRFAALDAAGLTAALRGYVRDLRLPHPRLLATSAIAEALRQSESGYPAVSDAFARHHAQVALSTDGWPVGLEAVVSLDDPTSARAIAREGHTFSFGPVPEGTWTMTVRPSDPTLPAQTLPMVIGPDDTRVPAAVDWPHTPTRLPDLPEAYRAGAYAVVAGRLLTTGGALRTAEGLALPSGLIEAFADAAPALVAPLGSPTVMAPTVEYEGQLYVFGGYDGEAPSRGVWRISLGATPVAEALPDVRAQGLFNGNVGVIGSLAYMTGLGTEAIGDMLAFDLEAGDWASDAPPMPDPSINMASAVVGETLYFFGGIKPGPALTANTLVEGLAAQAAVWAFTPGAPTPWAARAAMPTARSSAAAVTVDGRVWVIGGADSRSSASAAVEVYDPATDTWSRRPQLKVPRSAPMILPLPGRLLVIGGQVGDEFGAFAPLAAVEEIRL